MRINVFASDSTGVVLNIAVHPPGDGLALSSRDLTCVLTGCVWTAAATLDARERAMGHQRPRPVRFEAVSGRGSVEATIHLPMYATRAGRRPTPEE